VRVRLAIAAACVVVVAGLVVSLSLSAPRRLSSNAVVEPSGGRVFAAGGGGTRCQDSQSVPGATAALRLFLDPSSRPGGPLEVTVATGGRPGMPPRVQSRGRLAFPVASGHHDIQLRPHIAHRIAPARICLINHGRGSIAAAGDRTPSSITAGGATNRVAGENARIDYFSSGSRSWWTQIGTVARRFGLVKTTFFGTWTAWAVLILLAGVWIATLTLLLRRLPR
jgi:hypothetical protein